MGQFDQIKDDKEIISAKVENAGSLSENNEAVKSVDVPSEEELQAKEAVKAENKIADEKKIDELKNELMNEVESKDEFPEGHLMNPKTAINIAQLEAIDWDTLEFSQEKYDQYVNSSEFATIQKGIEDTKKRISEGKKPRYDEICIYGKGGYNRYGFYNDGKVKLDRGNTVTSGTEKYTEKLLQKARELGFGIN